MYTHIKNEGEKIMRKILVVLSIIIVVAVVVLSGCSLLEPRVPVQCGEDTLKVPLEKAREYKEACITVPEDPDSDVPIGNIPQGGRINTNEQLAHLAYWTTATEKENWPEMSQFSIVACHNDPDSNGNAKVVFLIGEDIQETDLQLVYFNGYSGTWSESVKNQIITEIQDSVRPHVPGFNLAEFEIIRTN